MPFSVTKLSDHDPTWPWKAVLRSIALVFDIAGIALTAWALADALNNQNYFNGQSDGYYYADFDSAAVPWNIISFSLSFLWCLTNFWVLLTRSRWIHPGANVGWDLVLWICFIVTALFSTGGAMSELYGLSGTIASLSYYNSHTGETYYTYANGTSYLVTPSHPAPPCPGFDSCAQEAHLRNMLQMRGVIVATASALAWTLVLIHFALFVSACRYTHQRRKDRNRVLNETLRGEAQRIEQGVIRRLEEEGRLVSAVQWPEAAWEPKNSRAVPDKMGIGTISGQPIR